MSILNRTLENGHSSVAELMLLMIKVLEAVRDLPLWRAGARVCDKPLPCIMQGYLPKCNETSQAFWGLWCASLACGMALTGSQGSTVGRSGSGDGVAGVVTGPFDPLAPLGPPLVPGSILTYPGSTGEPCWRITTRQHGQYSSPETNSLTRSKKVSYVFAFCAFMVQDCYSDCFQMFVFRDKILNWLACNFLCKSALIEWLAGASSENRGK